MGGAVPAGLRAMHRLKAIGTTDAELMRRIQEGDQEALACLYDRYGGLVYTLALRMCGHRDVAEEIVQDVFLAVWRRGTSWDPERGSVQGWLVAIARHRCIDHLRSMQPPELPLEPHWASNGAGPAELAETADAARSVRAAVRQLPDKLRETLEVVYYGGLTHSQAAVKLGIPAGTVKSRLRLAVERLAQILKKEDTGL